ncbi:MAG TPA: carboxypeptidase regulatory-like domain-containing protein [Acidiferrobacteraceae bacterium]|nr:carboxypeptidase regulatory-like domain-containing protein [Acidiferrobacteraceae bacterium]
MKRYRMGTIVVAVALAVGLAWYRIDTLYQTSIVPDVPRKDSESVTQQPHTKQASVEKVPPKYKPSEGYSKVAFTESDQQLMAELDVPEAAVRKLFKAIDSITGPIEFYGRVVDQHGKSVEGVKVVYSVNSSPGFGGPGRYTAITDSDGRFSVSEVRGITMTIWDATKPGYAINAIGDFRIRSNNRAELVTTYTPDNPYIISAWKLPEPGVVWSAQHSKVKLIPDGRLYSVTFADHRATIEEGQSDKAHLWISMTAEPDEKRYLQGSWSITIEAVDGGILPTKDVLMYEAPETGYARRWEKVYTMDEDGYKTGLAKQKLYFVAHNKGVYGRVVMDVYPFRYMSKSQKKKGAVRDSSIYLYYTVNPNGSRNLYGGKLHTRY